MINVDELKTRLQLLQKGFDEARQALFQSQANFNMLEGAVSELKYILQLHESNSSIQDLKVVNEN